MSSSPVEDANSRTTAARILQQYRKRNDIPARHLEGLTRDRAFVTELVLGVVRNQLALEWIVQRLASRKPPDALLSVLCVGLYQVLMMDRVEPFAAVHETVDAAKQAGGPKQSGFVNALLRRALREKEALLAALHRQHPTIRYSHPPELFARWTRQYGKNEAIRLCQWNNERPELILRIRPMVAMDQLMNAFADAGLDVAPHGRDHFVIVRNAGRIERLPGYEQGWFTVQDPATQSAVEILDPRPGERLLDACAAPGGKTVAIADCMDRSGTLIAGDFNPLRLETLNRNLKRCGCDTVQSMALDASTMSAGLFNDQPFDGILLDVPCSNTGVIRRRPDARRRITKAHLEQLRTLQAQLMDQAVTLTRPGGRVVYSTCSLEPEENEQQIEEALARHPEWTPGPSVRHFPPDDQMDGAFAAALIAPPH